jgi:TRAP-type mannitol/chloroaromatic compound transport system permease large subunit
VPRPSGWCFAVSAATVSSGTSWVALRTNTAMRLVLAIVMTLIFLIGFFLDFIEITFIHVPVLAPIMIEFGYDPIWFCILLAVNLQTSFLTPPFGFSLFYLKAVTPPEVTTGHIYRGIIPFVLVQIIGLAIVVFFPKLATWLPRVIYGP